MCAIYDFDEKLYENLQISPSTHVHEKINSPYECLYVKSTSQYAAVSEISQDKLTKVCLNFKNKTVKISIVFHELGSLYREKSPNSLSLIKSVALHNAALDANPSNADQIKKDLQNLCEHILNLVYASHSYESFNAQVSIIKNDIEELRNAFRLSLQEIEKASGNCLRNFSKMHEVKKLETICQIQKNVYEGCIKIVKKVANICENLLGEPPCKYAIIGLKSLAKKEFTPYSILDFNIVLTDDDTTDMNTYLCVESYFSLYLVVFYTILINAHETILPNIDFFSKNPMWINWFLNTYVKHEIALDGLVLAEWIFFEEQSATSTANDWRKMIQSAVSMVDQMFSNSDIGMFTTDNCTATCYVYGDKVLHDKCRNEIEQKFISIRKNPFVLIDDLVENNPVDFFVDLMRNLICSTDSTYTEPTYYNSINQLLNLYGQINQICAISSFDIVSSLADEKCISQNAKHKLMYAVALHLEIKWKIILDKQNSTNSNFFFTKTLESSFKKLLNLVGQKQIVAYFQTVYSLYLTVFCKLKNKSSCTINPYEINIAICSALQLREITKSFIIMYKNENTATFSHDNFDNFIGCLEQQFNDLEKKITSCDQFKLNDKIERQTLVVSKSLYQIEAFSDAFECVDCCLSSAEACETISKLEIAEYNAHAGQCLFKQNKYKEAITKFQIVQEHYQHLCENSNHDIKVAKMLYKIGICRRESRCFVKAKLSLSSALEIFQKYNVLKEVGVVCYDIGLCLMKMKKYKLAVIYFKTAIETHEKHTREKNCFFGEISQNILCILHCYKHQQGREKNIETHLQTLSSLLLKLCLYKISGKSFVTTFWKIGCCFLEMKMTDISMLWFQKVLNVYENLSQPEKDDSLAHILSSAGNCLITSRQYYGALFYFHESMNCFEAKLDIAETNNKIAVCLLKLSEAKDSLSYFHSAIETYESVSFNIEHDYLLARLYNDIGINYMEIFNYDKSMHYLEKSLKIKKNITLDEEWDRNLAVTLNNIGICLIQSKKYSEAIAYLFKALENQRRTRFESDNDFEIAVTLNNIGVCKMLTDRSLEALSCFEASYQQCVDISQQVNLAIKNQAAIVLNNLGLCKMSTFHSDEAYWYLDQSLELFKESSLKQNDCDSNLAFVLNSLGIFHVNKCSFADALACFRQSMKIIKINHDSNCAFSALLHNNIGLCLVKQNYIGKSMQEFEQALAIYEQMALDFDCDRDVAYVLNNIGNVYVATGDYEIAQEYLQESLRIQEKLFTTEEGDKKIGVVLYNIGNCNMAMDAFAEALPYFEQSLMIQRRSVGKNTNDLDLLRAIHGYGKCLQALKKCSDSIIKNAYLDISLKRVEERIGDNDVAYFCISAPQTESLMDWKLLIPDSSFQHLSHKYP